MKVPYFKAKDKDSDKIVEGFYFEYPVIDDGDTNSICIITHQKSAMGFINEPWACSIDPTTLEFVKYVDVPCDTPKIIL